MSEDEAIAELERPEVSIVRRRALLTRLRYVGTAQSVPVLRQCLGSRAIEVATRAVRALEQVGTDDAVDGLIECLEMDTGPRFTFAVVALRRLGSRRAMPALLNCLETRDPELDAGNKHLVILAMGTTPHVSQVPVLSAALTARSYRTRNAAAWALAQIRAPESTAALEAAQRELSWIRARPVRRGLDVRRRRNDDG
jgi:HEAT repeat protein